MSESDGGLVIDETPEVDYSDAGAEPEPREKVQIRTSKKSPSRRKHWRSKKNYFPCPEPGCERVLTRAYYLKCHIQTFHSAEPKARKHNEKSIPCPELNVLRYHRGASGPKHLPRCLREYEAPRGVFVCPEPGCKTTFSFSHNLERHVKKQHSEAFRCVTCEKKFSKAKQLEEHKCLEAVDPKSEDESEAACPRPGGLRIKIKPKKNFSDYLIPLIPQRSQPPPPEKAKRTRRSKNDPPEVGPFTCPHCPKVLNSTRTRRIHVHNVHKEFNFACVYCGKKYPTRFLCLRHEKTHAHAMQMYMDNKRKFLCDKCFLAHGEMGMINHMKNCHDKKLDRRELHALKYCERRLKWLQEFQRCPLCECSFETETAQQDHVNHHAARCATCKQEYVGTQHTCRPKSVEKQKAPLSSKNKQCAAADNEPTPRKLAERNGKSDRKHTTPAKKRHTGLVGRRNLLSSCEDLSEKDENECTAVQTRKQQSTDGRRTLAELTPRRNSTNSFAAIEYCSDEQSSDDDQISDEPWSPQTEQMETVKLPNRRKSRRIASELTLWKIKHCAAMERDCAQQYSDDEALSGPSLMPNKESKRSCGSRLNLSELSLLDEKQCAAVESSTQRRKNDAQSSDGSIKRMLRICATNLRGSRRSRQPAAFDSDSDQQASADESQCAAKKAGDGNADDPGSLSRELEASEMPLSRRRSRQPAAFDSVSEQQSSVEGNQCAAERVISAHQSGGDDDGFSEAVAVSFIKRSNTQNSAKKKPGCRNFSREEPSFSDTFEFSESDPETYANGTDAVRPLDPEEIQEPAAAFKEKEKINAVSISLKSAKSGSLDQAASLSAIGESLVFGEIAGASADIPCNDWSASKSVNLKASSLPIEQSSDFGDRSSSLNPGTSSPSPILDPGYRSSAPILDPGFSSNAPILNPGSTSNAPILSPGYSSSAPTLDPGQGPSSDTPILDAVSNAAEPSLTAGQPSCTGYETWEEGLKRISTRRPPLVAKRRTKSKVEAPRKFAEGGSPSIPSGDELLDGGALDGIGGQKWMKLILRHWDELKASGLKIKELLEQKKIAGAKRQDPECSLTELELSAQETVSETGFSTPKGAAKGSKRRAKSKLQKVVLEQEPSGLCIEPEPEQSTSKLGPSKLNAGSETHPSEPEISRLSSVISDAQGVRPEPKSTRPKAPLRAKRRIQKVCFDLPNTSSEQADFSLLDPLLQALSEAPVLLKSVEPKFTMPKARHKQGSLISPTARSKPEALKFGSELPTLLPPVSQAHGVQTNVVSKQLLPKSRHKPEPSVPTVRLEPKLAAPTSVQKPAPVPNIRQNPAASVPTSRQEPKLAVPKIRQEPEEPYMPKVRLESELSMPIIRPEPAQFVPTIRQEPVSSRLPTVCSKRQDSEPFVPTVRQESKLAVPNIRQEPAPFVPTLRQEPGPSCLPTVCSKSEPSPSKAVPVSFSAPVPQLRPEPSPAPLPLNSILSSLPPVVHSPQLITHCGQTYIIMPVPKPQEDKKVELSQPSHSATPASGRRILVAKRRIPKNPVAVQDSSVIVTPSELPEVQQIFI